jgi:hypothetical protein
VLQAAVSGAPTVLKAVGSVTSCSEWYPHCVEGMFFCQVRAVAYISGLKRLLDIG